MTTSTVEAATSRRSSGPILVTGMARAGTSWISEMLRAAGGFVHLNEPFNPKHPPGRSPGILNASVPVGYLYLTAEGGPAYREALEDTFTFRYRYRAELAQNHTLFDLGKMGKYAAAFALGRLTGRRPLLDDPYASLAAEWITEEFDGRACVVVRHPAAMVASYGKLGYPAHFRHFLDQPQLLADWLHPWRDEMETLVDTEDRLAQVAVFWRCLHYVLGRVAERSPRLCIVRYEDLCSDPHTAFGNLFAALGLTFSADAAEEVRLATSGASRTQSHRWRISRRGGLSRTAFRPMDSKANIGAWRSVITPEEAVRLRDLTEPVAGWFYDESDW